MRRYIIAFCAAALLLSAPAVAGQEVPYGNESNQTGYTNWTDNRSDVDLVNTSHYLSRVGTFVIGDIDADAGAGPLFLGLVVSAIGVGMVGRSRAGLVASGTAAILTLAVLSGPAAMLPRWLYGTAIMLCALVMGFVYISRFR